MKEECKCEFKICSYDIFTLKPIFEKEFKCINCDKRIRMKISRILINSIIIVINAFFTSFTYLLIEENIASTSIFVKYGYLLLIIIGFLNMLVWAINYVLWLFRKKIKYIVIEDNDTK